MFDQTKALCQHFIDMGIPGFDLIVYKDGECILRHMGGYADLEKKIPMQGNDCKNGGGIPKSEEFYQNQAFIPNDIGNEL